MEVSLTGGWWLSTFIAVEKQPFDPTVYMDAYVSSLLSDILNHRHHFNVCFLPRLIQAMDGCFPTA